MRGDSRGKGETTMARQGAKSDVPAQDGRVAVVIGGNSGIGFEAARVLASRGAHVVLAVVGLRGPDGRLLRDALLPRAARGARRARRRPQCPKFGLDDPLDRQRRQE
ncbi:MAG: hypothetical protein NVSMB65_03030 [Chloroflexota bacterium]